MARPKGAKNKRSVGIPPELKAVLADVDPAVVLNNIYAMEHKALAKLVRSAAGARAMALRVQAATAAMPYVHSKMPVAVTLTDERLPVVVIDRGKHQMIEINAKSDKALQSVSQLPVSRIAQDVESKGESDE